MIQPEFLIKNDRIVEFWKFYPLNENINFYINQLIEKRDEKSLQGTMLENSLISFLNEFNTQKSNNLVESALLLDKWFNVFRNFDGIPF